MKKRVIVPQITTEDISKFLVDLNSLVRKTNNKFRNSTGRVLLKVSEKITVSR